MSLVLQKADDFREDFALQALWHVREAGAELEATGLDVLSYNRHFGLYCISLKKADIEKHREYLKGLLKKAYELRA